MSGKLTRTAGISLSVLISLALVGCGGNSGPTTGQVVFKVDGSPVRSGSIEFRRTSDQKRFTSRIASDGSFQPVDEDGAVGLPPGDYDVVVVQIVISNKLLKHEHTHGLTVDSNHADYSTTNLKFTVEEGQLSSIDIRVDAEDVDA